MAISKPIATTDRALPNAVHASVLLGRPPSTTDTRRPVDDTKPIEFVTGLIPLWIGRAHAQSRPDLTGGLIHARATVAGVHVLVDEKFSKRSASSSENNDLSLADYGEREWISRDLLDSLPLTQIPKRTPDFGESTIEREWKISSFWSLGTALPKISPRPAWRPQIESATSDVEIIAILRLFGLGGIANRLCYLRNLADEEPDETPIEINSLRSMALFLMGERQLHDPQIGVTPDGLAHVEWRLRANGILAMQFLTSGQIRFAALSAAAEPGAERPNVRGTLPQKEILAAVRSFTRNL